VLLGHGANGLRDSSVFSLRKTTGKQFRIVMRNGGDYGIELHRLSACSVEGSTSDAAEPTNVSPPSPIEAPSSQPALAASSARLFPWLIAVAFFMESLDTTILNTGVPTSWLGTVTLYT